MAHARISKIMEGDNNLLKDLSITGCCIECTALADIQPDTRYLLEVQPERASHIGAFELQVERKWVRNAGYSTELGFSIISSPKGKQFQRYVDYLSYRNSHS